MINFKKGPALSLHQVNYIGAAKADEGVVAGMIVRIEDGEVVKGASDSPAPKDALYGFAINNQDAGDVIESGKIGVYALDGSSVVETDQYVGEISSYTVGALLTAADGDDAGKVKLSTDSDDKIIGQVEGTRNLPGKQSQTTNVTLTDPSTGESRTRAFSYQPATIPVLAVKLAS